MFADVQSEALALALAHARGCYQRNLIRGVEALSGSTLRGKAKRYAGRYGVSRDSLLARLADDDRLDVREERREHGRRVLVITLAEGGAL